MTVEFRSGIEALDVEVEGLVPAGVAGLDVALEVGLVVVENSTGLVVALDTALDAAVAAAVAVMTVVASAAAVDATLAGSTGVIVIFASRVVVGSTTLVKVESD